MDLLPPFIKDGPIAPVGKCARIFDVGEFCGKDATWHVIWTSDIVNCLCCDEHYAEARHKWVYYAAHQYIKHECSAPNAIYRLDINKCVPQEEDHPPVVSVAKELVAV